MRIFSKFRAPLFLHCVFYNLRHGRQKNNEAKGPFSRFWDLLAHFEVEGPKFLVGMCDRTAGFYHVLSVPVVPSGSVESAMKCQMTCLMKCFLRCVFERYDAVCHVCPTRRNRLWRPRKPWACGPKHCRFSRTSHGCLPMSCDTRGSKVPAILRDWQELDAEQAILWARSRKRSLRETDLGNTVVETQLCRATLSCSAHSAPWRNAPLRIAQCCRENAWKHLGSWGNVALWCVDMSSSRSCASVYNVETLAVLW